MNSLTIRQTKATLFLITFSLFLCSLYFEFIKQLAPCPLCIMQRIAMLLLALSLFAGLFMHSKKATFRLCMMQLVFALAGIGFALRQLYLQSLPESALPSCGPGLNYLIKYFPLKEVMHALFFGSGECGEVQWQFLGLSMPAWSLLSFLFIIAGTVLILKQNK